MTDRITTPLRDLLLVELPPRETVSEGGIVIPETAKEEAPDSGTVLRSGPLASEVSAGDVVWFYRGAGVPHPENGRWRIMQEAEILAVSAERAEPPDEVVTWVNDWMQFGAERAA
jgi:co-chaperonin GroES (HSP10)